MLFDPLLHLRETLGVGGRRLVIVSNMDMGKGGAGLEGLLRRLDLLGRQDRDRGIVLLARNGAGDGDSNNNGVHPLTS